MAKFNLSKTAAKTGVKNYSKMLEDNVLVPGGDVAEKNINLSLPVKENDTTVPYESQLEASRDGKDNLTTVEKALDENKKVFNDRRLDQTGDVMPINLETIKHEQKKEEAYKNATTSDSDTAFWDKYLNISVGETKVDVNVPDSQLQNNADRFEKIDDATKAKYDKMTYASLKDADAMLFHIYATAAKAGRKLNDLETQQVADINSGKIRILTAAPGFDPINSEDSIIDDEVSPKETNCPYCKNKVTVWPIEKEDEWGEPNPHYSLGDKYDVTNVKCESCGAEATGGNSHTGEVSSWLTSKELAQSERDFAAQEWDASNNEWYGRGNW